MLSAGVIQCRIIARVEAWSSLWVGALVSAGHRILDGGHVAVSTLIVSSERHVDSVARGPVLFRPGSWVNAAILDGRKAPSELTSMRVTMLLEVYGSFD